jgi:hypothetical protein
MAFFRSQIAPMGAGGQIGIPRPAPRPISGGGMARPVGGPARSPQATETLNQGGMQPARNLIGSFKKGGRVKKTGAYKLHKGEQVITAPVARMLRAK